MVPNRSASFVPEGFAGAVTGLGLSDVIQLNGQNRFSGCIAVHYDVSTGLLFFRDGEIVHAEQGASVGEEAFYEIMRWPGGRFAVQPNVATTSRTIHRGTTHLLLEAHRLIDERRAGRDEAAPAPGRDRATSVIDRIRAVEGVEYALLLTPEGARIGDDSYDGETLEGQTVYLAMLGERLGDVFRTGHVRSALVQGSERHLLLVSTARHGVSVVIAGSATPGVVESEIRKLLQAPR